MVFTADEKQLLKSSSQLKVTLVYIGLLKNICRKKWIHRGLDYLLSNTHIYESVRGGRSGNTIFNGYD